MNKIVFALPGNEHLSESITANINAEKGQLIIRNFPDGESYVRVINNVAGKEAILMCTLNNPDQKFLPLYFLAKSIKEQGAAKITLVSPYLSYMRQDKKFNAGEAVTSEYFATLISSFADELITVDPHLHRRNSMAEIYSIPCYTLHAADLISEYIRNEIKKPLLIGPDSESEQWVSKVAAKANAPFIILEKKRTGDKHVKISIPHTEKFKDHLPVLVDDIISTARTMIETIKHINHSGMKAPVCIGVHPVFAGNSYEDLKNSGVSQIVTCNTIEHKSNGIDISRLLSSAIKI